MTVLLSVFAWRQTHYLFESFRKMGQIGKSRVHGDFQKCFVRGGNEVLCPFYFFPVNIVQGSLPGMNQELFGKIILVLVGSFGQLRHRKIFAQMKLHITHRVENFGRSGLGIVGLETV